MDVEKVYISEPRQLNIEGFESLAGSAINDADIVWSLEDDDGNVIDSGEFTAAGSGGDYSAAIGPFGSDVTRGAYYRLRVYEDVAEEARRIGREERVVAVERAFD